jgi:hypothetical protein
MHRRGGAIGAFGVAAVVGFVVFGSARSVRADVVDGEPATIEEAQHAFDEARDAFAASGTDCVIMCRALQSMARAAERICALTHGGDAAAKKRCDDARAKVEEAKKKVLAACPGCAGVPNDEAPDQTTKKPNDAGAGTTMTSPPPPPTSGETEAVSLYGGGADVSESIASHPKMVTVAVSPLSLAWNPYFVEGHVEVRLFGPISVLFRGGAGSFKREPQVSGESDRAFGWRLGGGVRAYFDAFNPKLAGAFLGIEQKWDEAKDGARWLHFVPGLTVDLVAGYKLVSVGGFTIETQVGASVVATDRRPDTLPRPRVVPTWDLAVGYTF